MKVSRFGKICSIALVAMAALVQSAVAAWQPGLRGGFVKATPGKGYNWEDLPSTSEIYEGPFAATNKVIGSILPDSDTCPPIWTDNRTWVFWGQMYFDGGDYYFAKFFDDSVRFTIDDEICLQSVSHVEFCRAEVVRPSKGWHDVEIRIGNNGGNAGPMHGDGKSGFGFAREPSAQNDMSNYPYPFDSGDMTLFRSHDGKGFPDALYVVGTPSNLGTSIPPYGFNDGFTAGGDPVSCSVDPSVTIGATVYNCTGWTLVSSSGDTRSGEGNRCSFVHPGQESTLTWRFFPSHRIDFQAEAGGHVSTPGGFFDELSIVTATAVPSEGFEFARWTGDVPAGCLFKSTLSFPSDKPRTLVATFRPTGPVSEKVYVGQNGGAWETAANWEPAGAPTIYDQVRIPESKIVKVASFAEVRSLSLAQGAIVSVNGAGTPALKENYVTRVAQDKAMTGATGLSVVRDLHLEGDCRLVIGGKDQLSHPSLTIGGDLSLSGTAKLIVYAGPLVDGYDYVTGGAEVVVGGTATIGAGCVVRPFSHSVTVYKADANPQTSGLAVTFDVGNLVVEEGGEIDADGIGFSRYSLCPVAKDTTGNYYGGGYGGKGGSNGLGTYGHAFAPLYPGCAAGNAYNAERWGGGIIRLTAREASIAGTLTACGALGGTSGGGAGGGIFLVCDRLDWKSTGRLLAEGGYAGDRRRESGGGGGGRIAVAVGLDSVQVDSLLASGTAPGLHAVVLSEILPAESFSVEGGLGNIWEKTTDEGETGTAWYLTSLKTKTPLSISTAPLLPAAMEPSVGLHSYEPGTPVTATAPEFVFAKGRDDLRYHCTGYTLTDSTGSLLAQGDRWEAASFVIGDTPAACIWQYGEKQVRLTAMATDRGSVSLAEEWKPLDGVFTQLTATPADESSVFGYWAGDVDTADRFRNPLTLAADRPRAVKAVFVSSAPSTTYTWKKEQNNAFFQWTDATCWEPEGIPGPNDTAIITDGGWQKNIQIDDYACVGNLVIQGKYSSLRVGATTERHTSRNPNDQRALDVTSSFGLHVRGDLTVSDKGLLSVGGLLNPHPAGLTVDGSFLVGNEGAVVIFGCETNGVTDSLFDTLSSMEVAGKATIAAGGTLYAGSHSRSGNSPELKFSDLHVEEGGTISAKELGYKCYRVRGNEDNFPWPTHYNNADNYYLGASHGGLGGDNRKRDGQNIFKGEIYGYTNTPVHPGMQGVNYGPIGGGAIRIVAEALSLDGTITAAGTKGGCSGGSSGGSIWIVCNGFTFSKTGALDVSGGPTSENSSGAGGGGRAAIAVGLTRDQIAALRSSDEVEGVLRSDLSDVVSGFTAAGGTVGGWNGSDGQAGTGVHLLNVAGRVSLNITGEPSAMGAVRPSYGIVAVPAGEPFAISAPSSAFVVGSEDRSRRVCSGYMVTNDTGTILAQGTFLTDTLSLSERAFLTWDWSRLEHRVDLSVSEGGSISTNSIGNPSDPWQEAGSAVSVKAVAKDGFVFAGWLGDAEGLDRKNPEVAFLADHPRSLQALFVTTAPGVKTWTGNKGSWLDPDKWTPAGLPGPKTDTLIPSGIVLLDSDFVMEVGSLSIGKISRLDISGTGAQMYGQKPTAGDLSGDTIGLKVNGVLDIGGRLSVGGLGQKRFSRLVVSGDLILTNGASSALSVYAGTRADWDSPAMFREGGGSVTVGGLMRIGSDSVVRPFCDPVSGSPVIFRPGAFRLENGGLVNANDGGYYFDKRADGTFISHGPGAVLANQSSSYVGASYGGHAGGSDPRPTYGKDFAPYQPGSPGGNRNRSPAGGAIRIDCAGRAELYGTMTANGTDANYNGGHSGGSIWITARRIDSAETALLQAKGGDSSGIGWSMSGGGGRICLATHLTAAQIANLYTAPALPKSIARTDLTAGPSPLWKGIADPSGGSLEKMPERNGEPGTAVFLDGPAAGTLLLIR